MGIRDWISGLRKDQATDQQIIRWQKALSDFGYPYDLVSGSIADEAFASAKELGRQNGFVPLILVPGHWNSRKSPPSKRCERAQELMQTTPDVLAMYDDLEVDPENPNPDEFDKLVPSENDVVVTGLSITKRYVPAENAQRAWDEVAIVSVPATSADELPAYFEWGGWNSAPSSEQIVAVARHWRQAYGSELVAMGPDLLEFSVSRPPQDHASAISLLKEQYVFAPDSFEFDREYLERVAAQLRVNKSWVFWWD